MKMKSLVILVQCLILVMIKEFGPAASQTYPDRSATSTFPFVTDLDHEGDYVLRWGFNDTDIWFEVQVHTKGYVGFGISEDGKMVPADVFVAYVDTTTNRVQFKDYHTVGYRQPVIDRSQDWFIDYGYEESNWTVLAFHRRLDTCDVDDRVITSDTIRIIYSYSSQDPMDPESLTMHEKRGIKSVALLTTSPPPVYIPTDTKEVDLLNDNYVIPSDKVTTFRCRVFNLTAINRKHHIIKISPVISESTEHYVGHMILYRCHVKNAERLLRSGESFECFTDAPQHIQFCREHIASFGHGKSDFFLPEDVGIPFGGGAEASHFYVLATHYENEMYTPNLVDNSGIRITYTSQLRQHDAAFLSMGNIISPNWSQFIPPGDPKFVQKAYCSMRCLQWGLGDCDYGSQSTPITAVGVQFHSHSLGREMKLRHMTHESNTSIIARENQWLANDKSYNSDQQAFRLIKNRPKIACNDSLLLECTYDSSQINRPIVGGWTEYDEICRGYVLYYPRREIEGCMSWSNYDKLKDEEGRNVPGKQVFIKLIQTNWFSTPKMRENLKHALDASKENGQCWSSSPRRRYPFAIDFFDQPILKSTYSGPQQSGSCS